MTAPQAEIQEPNFQPNLQLVEIDASARALQQYASLRADQISSVMIGSGYSFSNDRRFNTSTGRAVLPPNANIAAMIVHGDNDWMVPYNQGRGESQGPYIWAARNIQGKDMPGADFSTPWAQVENWRKANNHIRPSLITADSSIRINRSIDPSRRNAPVEEYLVRNGNHAWHSWRNQTGGVWFLPYTSPNRNFDFSSRFGQFLIDNPKRR